MLFLKKHTAEGFYATALASRFSPLDGGVTAFYLKNTHLQNLIRNASEEPAAVYINCLST